MTAETKPPPDAPLRHQAPSPPDPAAAVVRSLYPGLRRYAAVVGHRSDDPDDLVQEAMARVLASGRIENLENPSAFIRRSIYNLVIDRGRSETRRSAKRHLVANGSSTNDVYPSDLAVLDRLTPIDRALIFLVDVEGWSFMQAATMVGVSSGAARLRASRARRKLRTHLENQRSEEQR